MKLTLTDEALEERIQRLSKKQMAAMLHDLVFELHGDWNSRDEPVIRLVSFWEDPHLILKGMSDMVVKPLKLPTPVDPWREAAPES